MFDKDNKFGFINNNSLNLEINKPYIKSQLTNLKVTINNDGLINTDGFDRTSNSQSKNIGNIVYKNFEDSNLYNIVNDITNKIYITIKNNKIIVFDNIFDISKSQTCFNARYYLTLPEGFTGTYYFNVSIIKDRKYTVEEIMDYKGGVTIGISYLHAPEITDFMKGDVEINLELVKRNPKNISSFYQFQEVPGAKYAIAPYGNDYSNLYVGDCSVNFGEGDIPRYSYISGYHNDFCRSLGVGYPSTSSYLNIFGSTNTLKMISYGFIGGYKNTINSDYRGAGMAGVLCVGANNIFEEQHGNRDGYLGIIGQGIKCYKSGVFLGTYGDVPPTEMFAVCNGSSSQDKVLFSINRDTGEVTSCGTPTKDEHLTTKKYVDDNRDYYFKVPTILYDDPNLPKGYVDITTLEKGTNYRVNSSIVSGLFKVGLKAPNDDGTWFTVDDGSNTIGWSSMLSTSICVQLKSDTFIGINMSCVNNYCKYLSITKENGKWKIMQTKLNSISPDNMYEYDVVNDYNPTHKKYVDDKISSLPQLSFNESGELVVTINGVSKTFVPKE